MKRWLYILLAMCLISSTASAQYAFSGRTAEDWLINLKRYLQGEETVNRPAETEDLSRPGEKLVQYDFGMVQMREENGAVEITEVVLNNGKIADCMQVAVGTRIDQAGFPEEVLHPLTVLEASVEEQYIKWVYSDENGIYGAEQIAYLTDNGRTAEYTLTYLVSEETIYAIQMKKQETTLSQASLDIETAVEMLGTQTNAVALDGNSQTRFSSTDNILLGESVIGIPVYELVSFLGEPQEVQTLPGGNGRLLLYDGMIIGANMEIETGVENVVSLSVTEPYFPGPRGLAVGMTLEQAGSLFCCEKAVPVTGGVLYKADQESGELVREADGMRLVYQTPSSKGQLRLEVNFNDGKVLSWNLSSEEGTL